MASFASTNAYLSAFFFVVVVLLLCSSTGISGDELVLRGMNKIHLHFYLHEVNTGPNATDIKVVSGPSNGSIGNFGDIRVMDDPLTEGPDLNSSEIGRAQGSFDVSSLGEPAIVMSIIFVFTSGEYNGSTLAVLGHNAVTRPVREMPIVGGTGRFRLAQGYTTFTRTWFNATNGDVTLDFDVFVYEPLLM